MQRHCFFHVGGYATERYERGRGKVDAGVPHPITFCKLTISTRHSMLVLIKLERSLLCRGENFRDGNN